MGCSASGFAEEGGVGYPGAGREEREAQQVWEGGGDMWEDEAAEWQAKGRNPIVATAASERVLRELREREWGVAVCDAYYAYLYAATDMVDDDWNGHRRGDDDREDHGRELEAPSAESAEAGPSSPTPVRLAPPSQPAGPSQQQLQRLDSHRKQVERLENRQQERDSARQEVLVEISSRMMGLQDDPRVVLQVLGVPCEGGARPSNEQLLRALRTALIRHHPDRQVRSGDGSIKSEVEAEEVFKLLVRLRDELREDEDAQVAVAM